MTGILNVLVAGGAGFISPTIVLQDVRAGTTAQATLRLNEFTQGGVTVYGSGSSVSPPNWYSPGEIPPAAWCSMTLNSGTAWSSGSGSSGQIVSLAGMPQWQWSNAAVSTITANVTLKFFSDAAGTQLQALSTFNITVQRTS